MVTTEVPVNIIDLNHLTKEARITTMAFSCDVCGKTRLVGNNVSHANNRTKRVFRPNLRTVKALVKGAAKRIRVCTRCLRSGLIQKAV